MDGPGRAHGELAGRAIEYHVRKFAKKLKDTLTKKNEEFELEESHFEEERDPNYEKVDMAKTQAHFIKYAAEEILEYLDMGGEIEEWYQNKLSKVHSDVEGLHSWMEGSKRKEGMVEDIELEEDGKLKGGAKDPCWKGYQMVGTKKKGGRTVPNCVPREETELKSFKALREKVNGYQ
jgi:hypothetical protein